MKGFCYLIRAAPKKVFEVDYKTHDASLRDHCEISRHCRMDGHRQTYQNQSCKVMIL